MKISKLASSPKVMPPFGVITFFIILIISIIAVTESHANYKEIAPEPDYLKLYNLFHNTNLTPENFNKINDEIGDYQLKLEETQQKADNAHRERIPKDNDFEKQIKECKKQGLWDKREKLQMEKEETDKKYQKEIIELYGTINDLKEKNSKALLSHHSPDGNLNFIKNGHQRF